MESSQIAAITWEFNDSIKRFQLSDEDVLIGRSRDADLVLDSSSVSREHASISFEDGTYYIKDLDSSYGTRINEQMLKGMNAYALQNGDAITIGRQVLNFRLDGYVPQPDDLHTLELDYSSEDLRKEMEAMRMRMHGHVERLVRNSVQAKGLLSHVDDELNILNDFVENRFKEYEVLQEISQIIVGILDVRELLSTVLKLASRVLKADRGFVLLYDESNDDLRSMVTRHFDDETTLSHDMNFSQTIARSCYQKRKVLLLEDAMEDARFDTAHSIVASSVRSVVCLPLIKGDVISGVIYLDNLTTPGCFHERQLSFLKSFAAQVALALDNARLYTQAVTDGLTKLYNRKFIDERISDEMIRAERYERDCSVIILDIDFFKKVNDTYGHNVGDLVIQRVARTLDDTARSTDVVSRYGGEEFLMLLTETNAKGAVKVADRIREKVEAMEINLDDGRMVKVSISAGVAGFKAAYSGSVPKFVEVADQGLYRAKESGRNQVCCLDL